MTVRKSAEDRKVDIQQATLALAFEVGPDQVTTTMIADRLKLTQPAIYKHFPRKEDLWKSITERLAAQIIANIATASQVKSPIDRLRKLVLGHLRLVHSTPALPTIMLSRNQKGAQNVVLTDIQASIAEFSKAVMSTIQEAQADGSFRGDIDAQDIATLVLGIIQSLVLRLLITGDTSVLLKDTDRLLDLQLSTFVRQGERE